MSRLRYTGARAYTGVRLTDDREVAPGDYAGRYVSAELGAVYTVRADEGRLVLVHHRLNDPIPLHYVTGERFRSGSPLRSIEFVRGGDGTITGFAASNGRTRDVRFDKVE